MRLSNCFIGLNAQNSHFERLAYRLQELNAQKARLLRLNTIDRRKGHPASSNRVNHDPAQTLRIYPVAFAPSAASVARFDAAYPMMVLLPILRRMARTNGIEGSDDADGAA